MEKSKTREEYKKLQKCKIYPSTEGEIFYNKSKNRYTDVIANDRSRVLLDGLNNNYINANHIIYDSFKYISTQSPIQETCRDFWKMVYDQKTPIIIMLTDFIEGKAEKYWLSQNTSQQYFYDKDETEDGNPICIDVRLDNEITLTSSIFRTFHLKYNDTFRIVYHIQYTKWGDHKTPAQPDHINNLIGHMDLFRCMGERNNQTGPPILHCSAGIGRAGTFIICSIINKMKVRCLDINIPDIVSNLRKDRNGMVQTYAQYKFLYEYEKIWAGN